MGRVLECAIDGELEYRPLDGTTGNAPHIIFVILGAAGVPSPPLPLPLLNDCQLLLELLPSS